MCIRDSAYAAHREGRNVGIIATSETLPFYNYGIVKNVGTRENEKTIARGLYSVLREFDEECVDTIYSESFAVQGIGTVSYTHLDVYKRQGQALRMGQTVRDLRNRCMPTLASACQGPLLKWCMQVMR